MQAEYLLNEAVEFAAQKHAGQLRKGSNLPYIVHPMEVAAICASLTEDEEVLAAAVLHDVIENAGVTVEEIKARFSERVAAIVAGDSEDKRENLPPAETWKIRKMENIEHIKSASNPGVRIVCLGDKLSNIRSIQRDFERLGDGLWQRFNQKDPAEHAWYYSTIAEVLRKELSDTDAWREYSERVSAVFSEHLCTGKQSG
ncbi:MAG: HD domain-containing protein [Eggerthellaceae bacterium]|nr:HD domain-containing protein [Eggerthellaceae bacterium]